jgi:acetolactate synthase I/II/III large subunit
VPKMRLADFVAETLVKHGVEHVFMLTGGGAMHLNDALGRHPDLSYVCCHHEQALAMAAESYSRLSNKLACVNVTTGPGGINTLNGVFGAYVDSIPMIVISGQVKRETMLTNAAATLRQLGDQEANIVEMVKTITKWSVVVNDPNDIRYILEKALWLAKTGRPGPTWVDIPIDVQGAPIEVDSLRGFDPLIEGFGQEYAVPTEYGRLRGSALRNAAAKILSKLKSAQRPVILAGMGVRLSGGHKDFLKLVDRLGIPVTTGWNAHDVLCNDNAYYAGRPGSVGDRAGNFAVQNSDLLLVLGSRLNIRQVSYNYQGFAREAYKIMVDIDTAEMQKPTLSIDYAVHASLDELFQVMLELTEGYECPNAHAIYLDWAKERVKKYSTVLPEYWNSTDIVNPYCFTKALFDQLGPEEIVVTGDGTACVVTFQAAELKQGQRLYTNSGSASMGYDLPAAIGAHIAAPDLRIICIAGDGSIMQNLQELQTIAGAQMPIKVIIVNNNGYHSIRQAQQNYFEGFVVGCGPETGVSFPDFEKVAICFGLPFMRIQNHNEMATKITAFLSAKGPAICEVFIDQDQVFAPKTASRRLEDGRMVSAPLEDLAPFLSREELKENMLIPLVE